MRLAGAILLGFGVLVAGAVLGFWVNGQIYSDVRYCLGGQPLDFDAGGDFAIGFEALERAVGYALVLIVAAGPFLAAAVWRGKSSLLAAGVAAASAAAVILFVVGGGSSAKVAFYAEYFHKQEVAAARCPAG
jgi:hypothetical protein